jgi:hypothetical protein
MSVIIDIDVNHHSVVVEGVRVARPAGISVSYWEKFWMEAKRGTYSEGYRDGYGDAEREAADSDRGHRPHH